ncbi:cation-transporting P-type ATPase [Microbacterium sp. Sa4CUA7]|uniref:Cation-transporting P-type ATPase n=1 Tax=Microbacterium pullorum TaxID=2762236 RepID=A0ABR8RZN9_9MICO|nr:cation-transporting P-type ATPase [Microbacterium pullorum]MBD7956682.1 cation-transporting P-type ATPase [Microbacterium pullorum]
MSTMTGLSPGEVSERMRRFGPNVVARRAKVPPWRLFLHQLTHLLAVLLWVAAGLALLAGTVPLAIAIVVIVVLNATFAFAQEFRADRSAERLRDLLPASTRVIRGGVECEIPAADLVPQDLVVLSAGDRVAADLEVIDADDLELDESMVTGESMPVPRVAGDALLGGTFVVQGEARAVVASTGAQTALAAIDRLSASATRPPSPLTLQLNRVVRVVALIAGATGVLLGAAALVLGLPVTDAFIFAVGVAVALVPEGLLPTVTLSLARGAEQMAESNALVRRLDAVETLGATTFICTDKTGTLTQNRMNVVSVVTVQGTVDIAGDGYDPVASVIGPPEATDLVGGIAAAALRCVTGRAVAQGTQWVAQGDPLDAAIHALVLRTGGAAEPAGDRTPYTADRMISSSLDGAIVSVLGAPESVFSRCESVSQEMRDELGRLSGEGLRILAVASREWDGAMAAEGEHGLALRGLLAIQDPPRPGVEAALHTCREAGIRIAMLTGDHPRTAAAIARQVGLLGPRGVVLDGPSLPADDTALADAIDHDDGVVVARATPADKFRIARALRGHGHVVAMTGDGVNDAPALREADVGIAMGANGSDVAREAADAVLLDDHFATIVVAIALGRATVQNVRRFLTYHLTDNVAELAPFAVWALSGGAVPLAIGVLQVLALDIASDMLPALALGAEPARAEAMSGRRRRGVVDRPLLLRAFLVLGPTEAVIAMSGFLVVLIAGGWSLGELPDAALLSAASGTAFAAIVLGQAANAYACRSARRPVWRVPLRGNPLVTYAVLAQLVLLLIFLAVPFMAELLGGTWPPPLGWGIALTAVPAIVGVDGLAKHLARRRAARGAG